MTDEKRVSDEMIRTIAETGVAFSDEAQSMAAELIARRSQQEPDGWRLVPVEPTPEMVAAGYRANPEAINAGFADAYRAMLAAAPQSTEGK